MIRLSIVIATWNRGPSLVRTLGKALDLSFSRIQFTPDLMPADVTGTNIIVKNAAGQKRARPTTTPPRP